MTKRSWTKSFFTGISRPGATLRREKNLCFLVSEELSIPELLRKWLQTYNHGLVMAIRKDVVLGRLDKYLKTDERLYWTSKEGTRVKDGFAALIERQFNKATPWQHLRVLKPLTFKSRLTAKPFLWKWVYLPEIKKNHFRSNGFALSLALKQRLAQLGKWPIAELEEYSGLEYAVYLVIQNTIPLSLVQAHIPLRFWGFISVPKAYQALLLDTAFNLEWEKYKALYQKLIHHNRQ